MLSAIGTRGSAGVLRSRAAVYKKVLEPRNNPLHVRYFASSAQDDKSFNIWVPIVGGLFITVGGGVKWWTDHVGGTEGLKRSVSFYSYAIPRYFLYRYHVWNKSPDEVWEALDTETSKEALKRIQVLRGFYIKVS
jgi:hypothetical protein